MVSKSIKQALVYFGLIIWVMVVIGGLAYSGLQRQVEFDPEQKFALAAMSAEFAPSVTSMMAQQYPALSKTVIHIQQAGCSCNFSNDIHVDRLDYTLGHSGYRSLHVAPSGIPDEVILPSLPAIMVFDEQGQLGYFGPYSSGYFCSADTAIVDRFLDNILADKHLGSAVVSEGYGCYCANKNAA
ncbi:MAG: DUF6436 domain-containing protein [Paraglaciecola chathamensis]|jgi:hypothetical protein|uniref:DUF6436 domain-containing protein n=1 Tax=Paraglaciecola agarilytica NO2 TaxID=1125747 RepID=A0ABQ0I6W1_9ALTE|nr:DUF6436 domain-containing protein [Paraglaciecola agarilytica]GAC05027.1 hypothetical protein GAGA_2174 [Paraglaciecola agarilytica NO2]